MRQPLIDADVLLYEVGFAVESSWKAEGKDGLPPFDYAAQSMDARIGNICAMVEATEPPILYLTGHGNFRIELAKTTPYKERPSNKPFHYYNLKAYIKAIYNVITAMGMEADDAMAIEQTRRPSETIICTRDKDLRAIPGWQFGWELGNQPQFGPRCIDGLGELGLNDKRNKLIGTGLMFFYSQCLTGDSVDTIPGLGGKTGCVKAYNILQGAGSHRELFTRVLTSYVGLYGEERGRERLLEQGRLLHMTRYLDEWGNPILWSFPYED